MSDETEARKIEVASGSVYTSGGGLAGGGIIYTPSVSPAPVTWPSTYAPSAPKPKKMVSLPPRIAERILVAFLEGDDDEEAFWAAKLRPLSVNIDFNDDGDGMLNITFSMEDLGE